jgi:uncharacterized protein DUF4390
MHSRSRRRWTMAALIALVFALQPSAHAEGIHIKAAELVAASGGYRLEASYEINLSATQEDALVRGLALIFVTEFELVHQRWWTLNLWNKTLAEFTTRHRLSYNALTRQYRLSFGSLHQNFDSVSQALAVLGRIRYSNAVHEGDVEPGQVYLAALRMRLDTSQLPKPLQIDALGSRDWNLSSDWYRWTFKP